MAYELKNTLTLPLNYLIRVPYQSLTIRVKERRKSNKYFTQEARKLGAEILAEEAFTPGEKDFSAILSKLKRLKPELIYLPTFYAAAAAILNQAKRVRFNPVVLANSSLFSQKTIELGGDAVEGILIPRMSQCLSTGFSASFSEST